MSRAESYTIEFAPSAIKQLANLPQKIQHRLISAIDALASDPHPAGAKRLKAKGEVTYRIRVAQYRVLYEVKDDVLLILVLRVGHRKDIYRGL